MVGFHFPRVIFWSISFTFTWSVTFRYFFLQYLKNFELNPGATLMFLWVDPVHISIHLIFPTLGSEDKLKLCKINLNVLALQIVSQINLVFNI